MSDENKKESSALATISEGAGLFLVGNIVSRMISLGTNIILTRGLGANLYGIFAYHKIILELCTIFADLGSDNSVLRYIPEYQEETAKRDQVITLAYFGSFLFSLVISSILFYFAPTISNLTIDEPVFVGVLRITSIVLPFNTLANITDSVFRSIERIDYSVAISSIIKPSLRLLFVGGAVLAGYSVIGAAAGVVVTGILIFVVGIVILKNRTGMGTTSPPSMEFTKRYYNFSIPLIFNQLGGFLYNRVDILMVGFFLSGSAVGVYNISVMVAGILSLPLIGFNQLFPPIASRLYQNDEKLELQRVYTTTTRWIFTLALLPGLAAILYAKEVLRIFGPEFPAGNLVFILFLISHLANCAVGPSGYLLMMTDHQYLSMVNQIVPGLFNVILNYILILKFGFIGAAVATAGIQTSVNIIRIVQLYAIEDIHPYDMKYINPLIAGTISAITMYILSIVLTQYRLLIVGSLTGGMVFVSVLFFIGIEDEEKELFNSLMSEWNS